MLSRIEYYNWLRYLRGISGEDQEQFCVENGGNSRLSPVVTAFRNQQENRAKRLWPQKPKRTLDYGLEAYLNYEEKNS